MVDHQFPRATRDWQGFARLLRFPHEAPQHARHLPRRSARASLPQRGRRHLPHRARRRRRAGSRRGRPRRRWCAGPRRAGTPWCRAARAAPSAAATWARAWWWISRRLAPRGARDRPRHSHGAHQRRRHARRAVRRREPAWPSSPARPVEQRLRAPSAAWSPPTRRGRAPCATPVPRAAGCWRPPPSPPTARWRGSPAARPGADTAAPRDSTRRRRPPSSPPATRWRAASRGPPRTRRAMRSTPGSPAATTSTC
ncbi:MAG: hypothetical protein MZV64_30230 [Ignavibacteriales bacterium]|nr:hypothetical protein [Ignavibacteriales bacterium]